MINRRVLTHFGENGRRHPLPRGRGSVKLPQTCDTGFELSTYDNPPAQSGKLSRTASMPLSAGDKLGPYEIVAQIGAGGMGEVYRARDGKLNRDVAIKVLPATLANDAQYMARFEREAQVLASLNHPNIATVYGVEQGALVMEFVEGANLRGPMSLEEASIARRIAAGLEAAHERSVVHRDLKPANIKLTPRAS